MKTLEKFLKENPSYVKCGNERLATRLNLSINTVRKFKNTDTFRAINKNYRES